MDKLEKKFVQIANKDVTVGQDQNLDANGTPEKWMKVIITDPSVDRDGDVIDTATMRIPVKPNGWIYAKDLTPDTPVDVPFLKDHSWSVNDQIGSARSMQINARGQLETVAGLTSLPRGQEVYTLAKEGHFGNAISGTFDYSNANVVNNIAYDTELIEFSVVFKGSNRDSIVSQVSKRLKGKDMAEEVVEQPEVVEVVVETPVEAPAEVPEVVEPEAEAEEVIEPEAEVVEADVETKSIKKDHKIMANEIAVKQVKDVVESEVVEKKATMSDDDQRILFVKQFVAFQKNDQDALARLNKKAFEGTNSKAIHDGDITGIFQTTVVASDIRQAYMNLGKVGSLVTRIDITGAETWRQPTQAAGNGFKPVGVEEVKQEDKPTWSSVSITPKEHALIVAWYDSMAKRTPLAVYQTVVQYIATEYVRLEDEIILAFAGVTTNGGDVFAATGLEPILRTAGRTVDLDSYGSADVKAAFGEAFGLVKSDKSLTLVCNRATWGSLATSVDGNGRDTFTVVGQQVALGALGTFNVVISEKVSDGSVVFGAMADYELVTIGGLETLFSQHATVGSLNLFSSDASALRAAADIAGKPVFTDSFVVIDNISVS